MKTDKNSQTITPSGTLPQPEQTVPDTNSERKFNPGRIMITMNCFNTIPSEETARGLARHLAGDWGEVCQEDWQENEFSLKEGFRLLSAYTTAAGVKFWIITEWDRSVTTILLPEDY